MKTLMLRVCYLGVAVTTLLASPGTEEPANAETTDPVADVLPQLKIADADALAETEVPAPLALAPAPAFGTNAPAPIPPIPLQEPTPPPNVKLSAPMADVVKLVQAGVSPDVLMAYITNSGAVFAVDSDVIVYLNDLGVTNTVITALIQHDSSPETAARKAAMTAVQPLPPGASTPAPASNVYPPAARSTFPVAGQTTYPGDFSTTTDSNLPPAVTTAVPAETVSTVSTAPPAENVTVNNFYSSLSPYGSWVDIDGYGLCWRPTVAAADPYWRPYGDRGRWLWSDAGWYWYSDYSWGWAPFHYGRWCSYPRLGWIWVPGTVWSPSWVTWRYTDGYCGWAPLPPGCGYRSGIGLTWYGHGISVGFDFGLSSHCWSYVPSSRFCDWNVRRHYLPANRIHVVHNSAVAVNRFDRRNNSIVNHGIEPNTIARASRTKIPTMKIKDHALPADARVKPERIENNGNTIAVTRPQLPKNQPATVMPVASRGIATKARPINLNANTAQAAAPVNRQGVTTPNASVLRPPTANNARPDSSVRSQRPAPANSPVVPNRAAVTEQQPATRPQVATPNAQRQSVPGPIARNNFTPTPNPAPVGRNLAPPASQQQPAARTTIPQQSAPQAAPAPAPRSTSPMIRSYAQPQASAPRVTAPLTVRPQSPMASPQISARPQMSAPSVQAPVGRNFAPPASAPSVRSAPSAPSATRSAPSGGGGGNGGGRSGGGGGGRSRGE